MVASTEQLRSRSIVIVEDDEDIADSIRYNLDREGFRVRVARAAGAPFDFGAASKLNSAGSVPPAHEWIRDLPPTAR
jgi:hypothetical protein